MAFEKILGPYVCTDDDFIALLLVLLRFHFTNSELNPSCLSIILQNVDVYQR